ncbi:MAG: DUF3440 domain-containing protein [Dysgonomonas sp.]
MNVYDAAIERLDYIFAEFDNVYVSFSGGKDSGILLNLCIEYIRKNNLDRKLGVFHIDYEAQYQMTTDYVFDELTKNSDILDVYHICLPISAQCATSMNDNHWIPWDADKRDIWVRDAPAYAITEDNHQFDFFQKGMWDYDFQEAFLGWYHSHKGAEKTCCLVGIRADESLNRWRAIYADRNINKWKRKSWTRKFTNDTCNAYPIFDWRAKDVWVANGRFKWQYNELYDLYYKAGLTIDKMRVASPFNDCAIDSLKLYKAIDPNNWAKMVGRVDGVNFSAIYGGTTAMGWKSIKLPKNHTWESYMYFLLDTLPIKTKENYLSKLATSIKFWKEKGGVLSEETIQKLKDRNIDISISETTNYKTEKKPVRMAYQDDIDISEFKEIPTFKRMCICIMKNDHLCKYMGFSQTKNELIKRKNVVEKYNNIL